MGALHEGHVTLIQRSHQENDLTISSIFVNPSQFKIGEDFNRYPRPYRQDLNILREAKVQIVFAPSVKSMYPPPHLTRVSVTGLVDHLCGGPRSRGPGHFIGVATIVAKLFNLVRPARAYFGLKDYQQLRVIEQMNQDLNFGVKIVRCDTVREPDGLALSSRNRYLTSKERSQAPALFESLQYGRKLLRSSPHLKSPVLVNKLRQRLSKAVPHVKIDYIDMVDARSLQPVEIRKGRVLLAGAIWIGRTRLIDNILI